MAESRPLLIRRDAERALSLAIAWFLVIPALIVGLLAFAWPLSLIVPPFGDCLHPDCPTSLAMPPYFVPAALVLVALGTLSIALYRLTYRRSELGWRIVTVVGVALVGVAIGANVLGGLRPELLLVTFAWPMAPGLMAFDAARRAQRRSRWDSTTG